MAPVFEGLDQGASFAPGVIAAARYLRFVRATSDQRLSRLFGLAISEDTLDREINTIMALAPDNRHDKRLRKRYGKIRSHLVHLP